MTYVSGDEQAAKDALVEKHRKTAEEQIASRTELRESVAKIIWGRHSPGLHTAAWEDQAFPGHKESIRAEAATILALPGLKRALELAKLAEEGKLATLDDDQSFPKPRDMGPLALLHYTTELRDAGFKRATKVRGSSR